MDESEKRKLESPMMAELVNDIKELNDDTDDENSIKEYNSKAVRKVMELVKNEPETDDKLSDSDDGYSFEKYDISFAIKSETDTSLVGINERSVFEEDDNDNNEDVASKETPTDFIKMEADIYYSNDNSLDIVQTDDNFFPIDYSKKTGKEFVSGTDHKSGGYRIGKSSSLNTNGSDISNDMALKAEGSFDYSIDADSYDEEDDFGNNVNIIIKKEIDHNEEEVEGRVIDYGRKTKKAKDHVCDICNKAFTSDTRLKRHKEQLHIDGSNENRAIREGKYTCKFCNKRFISQSRLNLHEVTHTGEKPFSCDVCGQKFSHPTNKRRHMKNHTGDKPFVCMFCGKSFPVKHYLKDHLVKHTGEKPHECKLCSMTFAHRFSLKQHELLKHPGGEMNVMDTKKDRPFSCEICGKGFTQQSSLKIHVRLHSGSKPYKCSECDASFIRSDTLARHKLEHTGQRPYQCDLCDKAFTSGYVLKQHRNVHTGDRRQQCELCGVKLANKESLTRHVMRHRGESMFECGICHKKFIHEQSLRRHQERPCEEKNYTCNECDYKSSSESKLKRHMLKHKSQKLLECKICKNKFTYPSNLGRHMKVHEKDHIAKTEGKETIITNDTVEQFIAVSVKDIEGAQEVGEGMEDNDRYAGRRYYTYSILNSKNKPPPSYSNMYDSDDDLDEIKGNDVDAAKTNLA